MSVKLKQLEGLAAIHSDAPDDAERERQLKSELSALDCQELSRFGDAGWQIVPAQSDREGLRRVYKDEAGHIVIEGRYLTLGLSRKAKAADVDQIFADYGLKMHRAVGLQRNMFQVEPAATGVKRPDLVRLCEDLENDDRIDWADPSLIESVGSRLESGNK